MTIRQARNQRSKTNHVERPHSVRCEHGAACSSPPAVSAARVGPRAAGTDSVAERDAHRPGIWSNRPAFLIRINMIRILLIRIIDK